MNEGDYEVLKDIKIVQIDNPSHFYGITCEDEDEYEILEKAINDYYTNEPLTPLSLYLPKKYEACIAKSSNDYRWHRVQAQDVLSTRHGPQANCFFVDDGHTELISIQLLRKAANRFLELPFRVKIFALYGIKALTLAILPDMTTAETPCKVWDTSAEEYMRKFLKENTETKYYLKNLDSEGKHYIILHVKTKNGEETMNDILVNLKFAVRDLPSDNLPERRDQKRKKVESSLNKTQIKTIQGYLSDTVTTKRSDRLQKCVDYQNRVELTHNGTNFKNSSHKMSSKISDVKAQSVSGHQSDVEGLKRALSALSKSACNVDTRNSILKSVSDTELMPSMFQQMNQNVCSAEVSMASQTFNIATPMLKPRIPTSVSPEIIRSPNATSPSQMPTGTLPRIPLGSRMAMLQSIVDVKPKNVSVSDTETGFVVNRNVLTNNNITHAELTNNKMHLSDGDNMIGLSSRLQHIRDLVSPDMQHVTQNRSPVLSKDGNISDSSTATSGSRNLLTLRGLIPNANPNLLVTKQMTIHGSKRLSDSSDTENVSPRPIMTTPKMDTMNSSSESSLKPILKRSPSSGEKQSVRFSDCESGPDKEDRKMAMFGQMKGKKLLDTLNIGCSRSKEQDTFDSLKLRQSREGILIHSCETVEAFYDLEEVPFHRLMKEVIRHLGFPAPTPIQSYVWRALFRGNNVVGIAAPNSGKTFCYLTAVVSHLMNLGSYAELPAGNGPIAVFLVPTWKKAQLLYDHAQVFIRTLSKPRALVIYGGNQEDSFAIPLINGCELLIATPPCLERMIEKKATHVDRLCHLVIDDADVLLEEFHTEVEKLMKRYAAVLKEQGQRSAPQQILMFSNQWCEAVYQFTWAYMSDPVIVFASMFEAAVYGKVKQVVNMCRSDQRSAQFVAMLDTVVTEGSRIVIFADTAMGAVRVNELLNRNSMYAIIAHSEMDKYYIDNARDEWYQPLTNSTDYKILVASDSCLTDLQITNATVVIHYDMAESKSVFGIRLSCMRDNFWSFDEQNEDDKVRPTSYIMMTEMCTAQARSVCELLKRTNCPAPPQLSAMLAGMSQEKEHDKNKDLCHFLKAYGECRNQSYCKSRHTILTDIAKSNKHPTSGEVKVIVTHVVDASHFYARLLEHRPIDGSSPNNLALAYIDIPPQMTMYFSNLDNRIRQTQLCPGELCALEDNEVFYRVKICDIFDTNSLGSKMQAEVFFVDEGRKKNVITHKLYVLPEKLKAYPQQAVSVYVCRLKPLDKDNEWTSNASMYIDELLNHKELEGRIVLSLENTLWLDPLVERVHLHATKTVINKMHVRSELLKNNFAVDNPEHIEKLYALCKGKVEIPDINKKTEEEPCIDTEVLPEAQSFHDVYLQEMELPDLIFLQKKETNKQLDDMMSKLTDRCKSEVKKFRNLQEGSVCLAQCSKDDSWNRAVVLEIIDDDNVEVFYADYGDKDTVPRDRIQHIPKEFMNLPFQAIECQLAHIKPRGEEWLDDSGDTLWDLSHGINGDKKLLVAKVISKSGSKYAGFHKYNVELFDTSTPYDVNLSQEMVWSGVASPQENSPLKELFPKLSLMGQVHISPVKKIADLCSIIYWTKDEKKRLNASKEIFLIVSKAVQKSPLDLIGYNGIAPIIKLIGRIINPEIHHNMLECLVCAAAAEDSVKCLTDNDLSVKSLTVNDLSVKSSTDNDFSVKSLTDNDLSVKSLTDNDLSVKSLIVNNLSVKSLTDNDLSVKSLTDNDLSIKSLTDNDLSVKNLTDNVLSVKSLTVYYLSVNSLTDNDLSVKSLTDNDLSVKDLTDNDLSVKSLTVYYLSVKSLTDNDLSVKSLTVNDLSVKSLTDNDLSVKSLTVNDLSVKSLTDNGLLSSS
ncbi:hypothetical protein KUTeg_019005 [Tegillarca granosa]|uniref:RNA helicase n=1 Tax=Tegillarca granosa TaxID=220873 RepID=A0ABQ9EDE7_TEGGR|nr:hypothetical protein KUTeg_019005 [Tegillarca granosa]